MNVAQLNLKDIVIFPCFASCMTPRQYSLAKNVGAVAKIKHVPARTLDDTLSKQWIRDDEL